MQAVVRFAVARDDKTSVVLDEEPNAFDQAAGGDDFRLSARLLSLVDSVAAAA